MRGVHPGSIDSATHVLWPIRRFLTRARLHCCQLSLVRRAADGNLPRPQRIQARCASECVNPGIHSLALRACLGKKLSAALVWIIAVMLDRFVKANARRCSGVNNWRDITFHASRPFSRSSATSKNSPAIVLLCVRVGILCCHGCDALSWRLFWVALRWRDWGWCARTRHESGRLHRCGA